MIVFSGVLQKGGHEAKHKFVKKVLRKGSSVAKRGCCEKGDLRCNLYQTTRTPFLENPLF